MLAGIERHMQSILGEPLPAFGDADLRDALFKIMHWFYYVFISNVNRCVDKLWVIVGNSNSYTQNIGFNDLFYIEKIIQYFNHILCMRRRRRNEFLRWN